MKNELAVTYIGNAEIDPVIAAIQTTWREGEVDRLKLGEYFSKLRNLTAAYKKDSKTGLTYTSAVKRTSVPRSTAELYRAMWEITKAHGIPAQVFLLLCDGGFNLATDVGDQFTVGGILQAHPELLSGENEDYDRLAETLKEDYGQEKEQEQSVDALQKFAESIRISMPDSKEKQDVLEGLEKQIHSKRISALKGLCLAIGALLGKPKAWAEDYTKKYADSRALTRQRYEEAVRFAQSLIQE
ncbi:MAG: hypothetical protein WCB94_12170 [Terriglobales bacterium]